MKPLVIFDLDGVLLDSEPIYMEMNRKFFKELGAKVTPEEEQSFVGISATKMWETIQQKNGLRKSVEELKAMERELKFKTLQEKKLVPTEGVEDLLKRLKGGKVTLAIASSSLKKNIDLILHKLNLAGFFDLVVSGEDVARGKPEPDIFLKVSTHFSRPAQDCVVIEDSTNGVLAAKSAGMVCLGYFNPHSGRQDLSKADLIFDRFDDPRLFQRLGLS
jgi:HAD superfamily hydrolase (TIGR01509 family)